MADRIFKDFSVDLVEMTLWYGSGRAALEDKGKSSFSKFSATVNKPTGRCSLDKEATSIYN